MSPCSTLKAVFCDSVKSRYRSRETEFISKDSLKTTCQNSTSNYFLSCHISFVVICMYTLFQMKLGCSGKRDLKIQIILTVVNKNEDLKAVFGCMKASCSFSGCCLRLCSVCFTKEAANYTISAWDYPLLQMKESSKANFSGGFV